MNSLSAQEWTLLGVLSNLDSTLTTKEKQMPVAEWIEYKVKELKERTEK
jgi:hypothetical protein